MRQTDLIAFQHFGNVPNEPLGGEAGRRLNDARQAIALGAAALAWLRRTFGRRRPADAPADFIPRGALVLLRGPWRFAGHILRARRDFHARQEADAWGRWYESDSSAKFAAWLESRGLVDVLNYADWWVEAPAGEPEVTWHE